MLKIRWVNLEALGWANRGLKGWRIRDCIGKENGARRVKSTTTILKSNKGKLK